MFPLLLGPLRWSGGLNTLHVIDTRQQDMQLNLPEQSSDPFMKSLVFIYSQPKNELTRHITEWMNETQTNKPTVTEKELFVTLGIAVLSKCPSSGIFAILRVKVARYHSF